MTLPGFPSLPGASSLALAPAVVAAFDRQWELVEGEDEDAKATVRTRSGSAHEFSLLEALRSAAIRFGMAVERQIRRQCCDREEFCAAVSRAIERAVGTSGASVLPPRRETAMNEAEAYDLVRRIQRGLYPVTPLVWVTSEFVGSRMSYAVTVEDVPGAWKDGEWVSATCWTYRHPEEWAVRTT